MRRAPSRAARSVRLEVTRGGDVVHGEDYRAAPSVVLSRAEEAFGDGHLVSNLPGVAGRLARRVAWAVGGRGGALLSVCRVALGQPRSLQVKTRAHLQYGASMHLSFEYLLYKSSKIIT